MFSPEPEDIQVNKDYRLSVTDIIGAGGDRIQYLGKKSPLITIKGMFLKDHLWMGHRSMAQEQVSVLSKVQDAYRRSLPFYASSLGEMRLVYIKNISYGTVKGAPGNISYKILLIQDFTRGAP